MHTANLSLNNCVFLALLSLHVQVLSGSVSKALRLSGDPQVQKTAEFADVFEQFFDIMNVTNFTNAKFKRKVFLNPYHSSDDFRLQVCTVA